MGKRPASSSSSASAKSPSQSKEDRLAKQVKKKACGINLLLTKDQQKRQQNKREVGADDSDDARFHKSLLKYNGANINNKSASRGKKKLMFLFPGKLDVRASGGKLGTLDKLDTKNPVLYVEYPEGRLKMQGTIVYPKTKYLAIQYKASASAIQAQKSGLHCRGSFDAFVVFSEYSWVGSKDENPEEAELPMPKSLGKYEGKVQSNEAIMATAAANDMDVDDDNKDDAGDAGASGSRSGDKEGGGGAASKRIVEDLTLDSDEPTATKASSTRRSGRSRSKVSYKEDSGSSDDDGEGGDDDDDEEASEDDD
mmetsp:Transcript_26664/g.47247  ORF Transcript_26664/g.47247 Transcript_26664/m.47247 type:complete len:310 (-) Transcript_26664:290-1219(-)|eukprot:CAMPEP_0197530202 /NCGR_PEP_ID=MMETSP1318-20131121/31039_1 /TAXON_ID=552666 /ORGANISM="Partenskyella glossopodia, Strain RCC365" /LENGTH=309 /DNA_ID=CAMNT_0043085921 /DNA_START=202 /DNA_END=1131 /DNA_ORIENTATION=-